MNRQRILRALFISAVVLSAWALQPPGGRAAEPVNATTPTLHLDQAWQLVESTQEAPAWQSKIEPSLLKQVLDGDSADQYRFVVELAAQANLSSLPATPSRLDRQHQVVTSLQSTARQEQVHVLAFLQARRALAQVQEIHPFWIFNGLAVVADADTLLAVASLPEVRIIRQDRWRQWVGPSPSPGDQPDQQGGSVTWNLARLRADQAWSTLRLNGSGVTVAIMDTGVDWLHPALSAQYRGYKPGGVAFHPGNWNCTTNEGHLYPVDGHGHGTHVTGLAVGGQAGSGPAIGVAPGAQWIAVKMLDDTGYGYDSWIHDAFEWLMAPNGDPALAPDVVNGSWGTSDARDETFRRDLQAIRAAGMVPIFAAGNDGPNPSSLQSPGSYPEVIAVGASDDVDQVASFSGRGPSPWDEVKPEVVAPGIQIWSSRPGGTYGLLNGTSMATPQVSGVVALLLQADPTLRMDDLQGILTSTASPLGEPVPNNSTGWGRVDAYQASGLALGAGFVAGQVSRHSDQQPLPFAQVTIDDPLGEQQAAAQADGTGRYRVALPPGQYDLHADAFGYVPQTEPDITVQKGLTTTLNLALSSLPAGVLWGQLSNAETGGPLGASLSVVGTPAQTTSNPQTGQYSLALPVGTYRVQVAQNGYQRHLSSDVQVEVNQNTRLDIALTPAPTLLLVDSGRWYYGSQANYFEQALDDNGFVYDLREIRDLTTDLPDLGDLSPYDITVWSSPLDAPGLIGAGHVISDYLSTGGNLLLTGQDVGYWDGGLDGRNPAAYYERLLKARVVADDAGRDDLVGLADEILHDLSLPMNGPDSANNQSFPDAIALIDGRDAAIIARYAEDGNAALRASGCQSYRAIYLAAGLEGLGNRDDRAEVMERALGWLDTPHPAVGLELYPLRQEQVWLADSVITYTVELRNLGQSTDHLSLTLSPSTWAASLWDAAFSQPITQSTALGTCQTQTLGIEVTVPAGVAWDSSDVVTLTARSLSDPTLATQATFSSKAPAPILLVDDHRWYDTLDRYRAALDFNGLPYDVWRIMPGPQPDTTSPSLQRLQRYRAVIWFTAYDWYGNLTPADERRLAAYLDGGGRLLLSSQDYLSANGVTDFATQYLGVANYTGSLTTTQVVGAVGSPVGAGCGLQDLAYPFRNRSDALRPILAAQPALWGQHGQPVAITLQQPPWKTTFFAFPLEAFSPEGMAATLGRTVDWLSPLGESTLQVDRAVAAEGERLAYTLQIRNTSVAPLGKVTLSNFVPMSTTYVAGSLEGPARYDPAADHIAWQGALAPGQTITLGYRLQLDVPLPTGTIVRNLAHLADESGLTVDRAAVTRSGTADLSESFKAVSAQVARSAQVITYTLVLRNNGLRIAQAHMTDPVPLYTVHLPGSAHASDGVLTSTAQSLSWSGPISVGQAVTITFPVMISPTVAGLYALNRATLDDGWGGVHPLETHTWVEAYVFLPLVHKEH